MQPTLLNVLSILLLNSFSHNLAFDTSEKGPHQSAQNKNISVDTLSTVVIEGKTFDFVLRIDTVHEYNEHISDSMHYFNIHAVEIYHHGAASYSREDDKFLQRFLTNITGLELWRYQEIPASVLDVNFDGFEDFEVLDFPGMYWNSFQYYIYNPDQNTFIQDPYLVELTDPTFHEEDELVHYSWHIGVNEFGHAVYEWEGANLKLIGKEVIIYFEDQWSCSRLKRVNGELIEVKCFEVSNDAYKYGIGPCSMYTRRDEKCHLYRSTIK